MGTHYLETIISVATQCCHSKQFIQMSVFCSKVVFSGLPTQHYEPIRTLQEGQPHTYCFIMNKRYLGFKFLIPCFLQSFERNVFIMLAATNVSISHNLFSPENFSFKIRKKKKKQPVQWKAEYKEPCKFEIC